MFCARLTDSVACPIHGGAVITTISNPLVLVGNLPVAVTGDVAMCGPFPNPLVQCSLTVLVGGRGVVRTGHITSHGGAVISGMTTVFIGG